MYPIVVVIHEPLEWLGLEVTGAEATPMGIHRGPS